LNKLTPPLTGGAELSLVKSIITWRQQGKPGYWKLHFQVKGPNGGKPYFFDLDNLKVDAPITLAKFITDKMNPINIGRANKTLVRPAQQIIIDHSKILCLARRLEERTVVLSLLYSCGCSMVVAWL
jgi:hypothetical protein